MTRLLTLKSALVLLATIGVATPQLALAGNAMAKDVALRNGNVLHGQVLNNQGNSQVDQQVYLVSNGQAVAVANTDSEGRFQFASVQGGVYQLHSNGIATNYRVWSENTAPPAAAQTALLVNDSVVRGTIGFPGGQGGGVMQFLSNPWVLGALVAAAIAIPVAIDNDDAS